MRKKEWVSFDTSTTKDFSESFKEKLTKALLPKLCDILEHKVAESEFEFLLQIGYPQYKTTTNGKISSSPFKLTTDNNYVFARTTLRTIFAQYDLTVCWTSSNFKDPLAIHKADVSDKNVEFYFCNDFPKDTIISDLAPVSFISKKESGYSFDVVYYLKAFPDVTIFFDFSEQPSETCLKEVRNELKTYGDHFKTVFIHEPELYKDYYIIAINHNTIDFDNYSDNDYQQDIRNLDFLLSNINRNTEIKGLKEIKFQ